MASSTNLFCPLAAFVVAAAVAMGAYSPAGAPVADCSIALTRLGACLSFVVEGTKKEKPEGNCCSGLKKVVKDEAPCLCQVFNVGGDFGIKINITKAMTLPHVCGVATPPISDCKSAPPASSPAPFAGAPGTSPGTGGGAAGVPATAPGTNSGMPSLQAVSIAQLGCVSIVLFSLFI